MKNKFTLGLLMGFGMGLIIASSLSLVIHKKTIIRLDTSTIRSEAKKLGMIDPEDYFERMSNNKDVKEEINESKIHRDIEVPKGASTDEIARLLYNKGLISSEKDFLDLVQEKEATNKLKWGTYSIEQGETLDNIIDLLSGTNQGQ